LIFSGADPSPDWPFISAATSPPQLLGMAFSGKIFQRFLQRSQLAIFPKKFTLESHKIPTTTPSTLIETWPLESDHFSLSMVSSMSDPLEWSKHSFRHSFPGVKTNAMLPTRVVFPLFGSAGIVTGKIHCDLCTIVDQRVADCCTDHPKWSCYHGC